MKHNHQQASHSQYEEFAAPKQQPAKHRRGHKAPKPVYNQGNRLGSTSMKLAPNIAAALSYAGWWITGLIFLIGERHNRFVHFHALQSVFVFLILSLVWSVLKVLFSLPIIGALGYFFGPIIGFLTFLIWASLIILALLGKKVKIPVIGEYAARFSRLDQPE
jgi:uncharacterized membrane protein